MSIRARVRELHSWVSHTGTSEVCAWPGIAIVTEGGREGKEGGKGREREREGGREGGEGRREGEREGGR